MPEFAGPSTPWMSLKASARYADPGGRRSPRFLAREIKAGRLRAARVGGRGEYVLKAGWIDAWLEGLATPVPASFRKRA